MTRREYGLLEDHIINTFRNDRVFLYHGKMCEAIEADKPRPQSMGGECKRYCKILVYFYIYSVTCTCR